MDAAGCEQQKVLVSRDEVLETRSAKNTQEHVPCIFFICCTMRSHHYRAKANMPVQATALANNPNEAVKTQESLSRKKERRKKMVIDRQSCVGNINRLIQSERKNLSHCSCNLIKNQNSSSSRYSSRCNLASCIKYMLRTQQRCIQDTAYGGRNDTCGDVMREGTDIFMTTEQATIDINFVVCPPEDVQWFDTRTTVQLFEATASSYKLKKQKGHYDNSERHTRPRTSYYLWKNNVRIDPWHTQLSTGLIFHQHQHPTGANSSSRGLTWKTGWFPIPDGCKPSPPPTNQIRFLPHTPQNLGNNTHREKKGFDSWDI